MVKHSQTIRRQKPTNCLSLSVFDYFWGLALEGLIVLKTKHLISYDEFKFTSKKIYVIQVF